MVIKTNDEVIARQIKNEIAKSRVDRTGTRNQQTMAGSGPLSLGDNGALIRTVGDKAYAVGKDDDRYGAITAEYYDQQRRGAGAPQTGPIGASAGVGGSGGSITDNYRNAMINAYNIQKSAYDSQMDAAGRVADANAANVNRIHDDAARQAYITMMQAKRDMPRQMAALGLAGTGMSESIALQNMTNYQNNINQNEIERAALVADIYNQLASKRADTGITQAQIASDLYSRMAERALEQYNLDRNFNYNKSVADRDFEYQKQMDELSQKLSVYDLLLSYGLPNDEIAAYLGVDKNALQSRLNSLIFA